MTQSPEAETPRDPVTQLVPDPVADQPVLDQPDAAVELATEVFLEHRELLFSIVYNLLSSIADTEDVLQETWLSWAGKGRQLMAAEIEHPRAYLVRIAMHHALARRVSLSRRRENYVGPWLPEPLITDVGGAGGGFAAPVPQDASDPALRAESVSVALLVVLETLAPLERAVFVLHEVFGYAHTEIAEILDRHPAAVRQLAHRAREHVQARRPRFRTDPKVRREVTERFLTAALGGDLGALMAMLAPDVMAWGDGGGKARNAGPRPVEGREKVARLLVGFAASRTPTGIQIGYRQLNGDPSALLYSDGAPYAALVVDLTADGELVQGVYAVTNPDKLSRID
jgi:RNA polymerase sigma factor (sigma-70 family)